MSVAPLRLLLLAHAFNGLTQRLFVALRDAGHVSSVELDIADAVTEEAVAAFAPDLVIAPFLKRRLPESVWSVRPCLVVHPGPPGDRGPAALDWAVLDGERDWGVTVLQATADFDAGPVWAWQPCTLRAHASKGSLYRHEVTQAAAQAVRAALARVQPGSAQPLPAELHPLPTPRGWRPLVTRAERAIDWAQHDADVVLQRVRSADGFPGVAGSLFGQPCTLFDAHPASAEVTARAQDAMPGAAVARRGPAVLLRCATGAVWIGHVRRDGALKRPAAEAFDEAAALPDWPAWPSNRKPYHT